jgi:Protein of unknown function (DUF1360)
MGGYSALLGMYVVLVGLLIAVLRSRRHRAAPLGLKDLMMMALATQRLSRLITKDSVLSPIRKPFTTFVEAAGEGEVNERVIGSGFPHAVGELISCPFCIGQWVATGMVAGTVAAPTLTQSTVSVLAVAQVSDYLQLAYAKLKDSN